MASVEGDNRQPDAGERVRRPWELPAPTDEGKQRRKSVAPWRERIRAETQALGAELALAEKAGNGQRLSTEASKHIRQQLAEAWDATEANRRERLKGWLSGSANERAWGRLHDAKIALASAWPDERRASERASLISTAKQVLPARDPRRTAIIDRFHDDIWKESKPEERREDFRAAMRWIYEASNNQYRQVRTFRNIVMAATVGLFVLAITLAVIGALRASAIPLCFAPDPAPTDAADTAATRACPTGENQDPSGGDVVLVEVLGLVGGAIAATIAIRAMRGTSSPYGVPAALAVLKLPFGALSALLVILVVRADFVPGLSALDTQSQILGYSLVFGYLQQVVTRLIDEQGQTVLDKVPTTEAPEASDISSDA